MAVECPVCDLAIQNKQALKMHMLWKHNELDSPKPDLIEPQTLEVVSNTQEPTEEKHEVEIEIEEYPYTCENCDTKLVKNQKYCTGCGKELLWNE